MRHQATANSNMPSKPAFFAYTAAAANLLIIRTPDSMLGVSLVLGLILVVVLMSLLTALIRRRLLFER